MRRTRRTVPVRLAVATAAAFALAACSGDGSPTDAGIKPSLAAGTPFNDAGQCMVDDVADFGGGPTNCTANDIRIARAEIAQQQGPVQCSPGQNVTINMNAVLEATSTSDRADIGIWISTDGGDARTGACNHYNLVAGTAGTINPDGDQCAGMAAGAQTTVGLGQLTIPCNIIPLPAEDADAAGLPAGTPVLKIGACLAWDVPGQDGVCPDNRDGSLPAGQTTDFRAATIPGTPAKCNCDPFYIEAQPTGSLTIVKDAVPNDAQDFAFTTSGAGLSSFSLDDDADGTLSNSRLFANLVNDGSSRSVTESATSGWDLTNISCSGATTSTVTPNLAGRSVSVVLRNGDNVTCTFTNTKRASIEIEKQTTPDGAAGSFAFSQNVDGSGNFNLSDNGVKTFLNVAPNTSTGYTVSESDPSPGFDLTSIVCTNPDGQNASTVNVGTRSATIYVSPGETVRCTYTNTQRGSITITKVTNPASDPQDFAFTATGTGLSNFSLDTDAGDGTIPNTRTFTGLQAGSYSVTESAVAGWDLTNLVCSAGGTASGATANITLAAGASVTCTYTNTKRANLTIVKDAQPNDAEDFSFATTGAGLSSFDLDDDADGTLPNSRTFSNIASGGARTVTEGAEATWDLTSISCTGAATWSGNTSTRVLSVTPGAGENITCTFVNKRKARLIVEKIVVGGGTQSFDFSRNPGGVSFSLTNGQSNNSGYTLAPATYRVCEQNLAVSWNATAQIDGAPAPLINPDAGAGQDLGNRCVDVPLAYGDSKTVTWTNTPPPGGDARTIGYWRNWSSCSNSAGKQYEKALARGDFGKTLDGNLPQTIGDLLVDTCQKGVAIVSKQDLSGNNKAKDPAYNMAAQLLAAKLNYSAGAQQCAAATSAIAAGQALLDAINFIGTGDYRSIMTPQQSSDANYLAGQLDKYNNNQLCAP